MKKKFVLLFLIGVLFGVVGCSKDEGTELSPKEISQKEVDTEYNKLRSVLPGTWEPYEHYAYNSPFYKDGWRPISEIYWDTSYIFNSDGTYVENSAIGEKKGTYRIEKNPNYDYKISRSAKVFLYLKENSGYERDYYIDLDENGYLRICLRIWDLDLIPSPSEGGDSAIRYKKK